VLPSDEPGRPPDPRGVEGRPDEGRAWGRGAPRRDDPRGSGRLVSEPARGPGSHPFGEALMTSAPDGFAAGPLGPPLRS
jgi:hypothetical protein